MLKNKLKQYIHMYIYTKYITFNEMRREQKNYLRTLPLLRLLEMNLEIWA